MSGISRSVIIRAIPVDIAISPMKRLTMKTTNRQLFANGTDIRVWCIGWTCHNQRGRIISAEFSEFFRDWVYKVHVPYINATLNLRRDRIRVHAPVITWWECAWVPNFIHFPTDPKEGEGP